MCSCKKSSYSLVGTMLCISVASVDTQTPYSLHFSFAYFSSQTYTDPGVCSRDTSNDDHTSFAMPPGEAHSEAHAALEA